jgi:hypothetical protein
MAAGQWLAGSNDIFDELLHVPPRFGRLVIYPGTFFHNIHMTHPGELTCQFDLDGQPTCPEPQDGSPPGSAVHSECAPLQLRLSVNVFWSFDSLRRG